MYLYLKCWLSNNLYLTVFSFYYTISPCLLAMNLKPKLSKTSRVTSDDVYLWPFLTSGLHQNPIGWAANCSFQCFSVHGSNLLGLRSWMLTVVVSSSPTKPHVLHRHLNLSVELRQQWPCNQVRLHTLGTKELKFQKPWGVSWWITSC